MDPEEHFSGVDQVNFNDVGNTIGIKSDGSENVFFVKDDVEEHCLNASDVHCERSIEVVYWFISKYMISLTSKQTIPLTDEEKEKKLESLKKILSERRKFQKIKEDREACENELIRRKRDREYVQLIEEQKRQAQLRDIMLRKEEKKQDLLEKKRIMQRIEDDKRERKERQERACLMKSDVSENASSTLPVPKTISYDTSRLQIRVEAGTRCSPIVRVFSSEDTLRLIAQNIFPESGVSPDTAIFVSTFPKKEYSGDCLDKTLKELQLVPSCVLILRSCL
ncbi:unnamed protein product [Pneumocystis jirovecii]|uniref:UBX domain-containing protein n=1 Tax=Pneumocystis jirovecii TaxID=42068 RepID=L0P9G4_PNEJI|nr:unnamed protein product [Pneumocystis jirovecii]